METQVCVSEFKSSFFLIVMLPTVLKGAQSSRPAVAGPGAMPIQDPAVDEGFLPTTAIARRLLTTPGASSEPAQTQSFCLAGKFLVSHSASHNECH